MPARSSVKRSSKGSNKSPPIKWTNQATDIWQAGLQALRPPEPLTVTEWAEKHLTLSMRITSYPGKFKTDRTPFVREPLNAFGDPKIRSISLMFAAQIVKTTFLLATLGYSIDQDPGSGLLVLPNTDLCKSFSDSRLLPLIEDCKRLERLLPRDRRKVRQLEIPFTNDVQLALAGANSPANLASRPVRRLYLDEIDKYPKANAREAGAVGLAEKRLRAQLDTKLLKTSTPTNTLGEIWRAFLAGDQRFYWVECPHCQHSQPLLFGKQSIFLGRYGWQETGRIAWPKECKVGGQWDLDAVEKAAYYECGRCKKPITTPRKRRMLDRGEWRPEAKSRDRSYQLSALYALWPSCSFGTLAKDFLQAKQSGQDGLQDLANSTWGEPWEVTGDAADEASILSHRLDYKKGLCPVKPLAICVTGDIQRNMQYWVMRAYGSHGASYQIDYGVTQTWDQLAAVAKRTVIGPDGKCLPTHAGVDSSDQTERVYAFCSKHNWAPIKGWMDRIQPITWGPGYDGRLLNVDTGYFKDALQAQLFNDPGTPGSWNLPANAGNDFASHMTAEAKLREVDKYGRPRYVWRQIREDNHWLDCEVYQLALAEAFGFEHLADQQNGETDASSPKQRRDGRDWWDR